MSRGPERGARRGRRAEKEGASERSAAGLGGLEPGEARGGGSGRLRQEHPCSRLLSVNRAGGEGEAGRPTILWRVLEGRAGGVLAHGLQSGWAGPWREQNNGLKTLPVAAPSASGAGAPWGRCSLKVGCGWRVAGTRCPRGPDSSWQAPRLREARRETCICAEGPSGYQPGAAPQGFAR